MIFRAQSWYISCSSLPDTFMRRLFFSLLAVVASCVAPLTPAQAQDPACVKYGLTQVDTLTKRYLASTKLTAAQKRTITRDSVFITTKCTPAPVVTDTIVLTMPVHDTTVVTVHDTTVVVRVDTVVKVDTVIHVDTLVKVDTVIRVDTVTRVDTLWLPKPDTTTPPPVDSTPPPPPVDTTPPPPTPLATPTTVSPGSLTSPGGTQTTLTPRFIWNAVPGASGYVVAIRNLTTNVIVYPSPTGVGVPIPDTTLTLPAGVLVDSSAYRWDVTAVDTLGQSARSTDRYFTVLLLPATIQAPEMPRELLHESYPVSTRTVNVAASANLQTALNNAQPGDELVLDAAGRWVGTFTLPAKGDENCSTGWIIVRGANLFTLPVVQTPWGPRATPASSVAMPRLSSALNTPTLATTAKSFCYYLAGFEIENTSVAPFQNYGIVLLGNDQTTLANVPKNLTLDRMYVHGGDSTNTSRCVALNSRTTIIINSYFGNCHGKGFDSQAIAGWSGPGPYKIVNNTLVGAGEVFMMGGANPAIAGTIPADLEFAHNYVFSPIAWKGVWTKKNSEESKCLTRAWFYGNVIDGSWADAQVGVAHAWKSANQNGNTSGASCKSTDFTFENNYTRHVAALYNLAGVGNTYTVAEKAGRFLIRNDFADSMHTAPYIKTGDENRMMLLLAGAHDVTLDHVTWWTPSSIATFITISKDIRNVSVSNSIFTRGSYGLWADGGLMGTAALNTIANVHLFTNNCIIGSTQSGIAYPATTVFKPTRGECEALGGGVNMSELQAAIAGVIVP